jgi:carboxyl-terminal processing protease
MLLIRFSLIIFLSSCTAFADNSDNKNGKLSAETIKSLTLFGEVFDKVKREYVTEAVDKELVESALNGMLSSLDPHSGYMNEKSFEDMKVQTKGEFGGLGIEVTMENGVVKVISPIDGGPAAKAGMQSGDYIFAIDNEPIFGLTLSEAVEKMRGEAGTKIHLTIMREGKNEPVEVDLNREVIKINVAKSHIFNNVGYIRINSFSEKAADLVKEAYAKITKENPKINGIILDLRNNPGGLLEQAIDVSDLFLESGEIVSTKGRNPANDMSYSAHSGDITKGMNMVVLINAGSASASEIVAGALQDHKRAVIMGTKSFGKGSVQTIMPLQSSTGAMKITTARYYTPSGKSIQAEGIKPDIIAEPAKIEFLNKKDGKKPFSESDLRKHLANEKIKKGEKETPDVILKNQNKKDAESEWYDQDYQLGRAIDLLTSLALVKNK